MSKDTGGSAFPCSEIIDAPYNGHNNSKETILHSGMTLRDYFAGLAMQSWLVDADRLEDGFDDSCLFEAKLAYRMADAMLKARNA